jgi:23S rRNA (uracil1939-C5)-methyltransferase
MSNVRCIHFGQCGGCSQQEVPYKEQLALKEAKVAELFAPLSVEPIIGSPEIWGYRNKMEYTFSQDRQGRRFFGLFQKSGRGKVMTLTECHLSPPWYIEVKDALFSWWEEEDLRAYHPHSGEGLLINLVLRSSRKNNGKMVNLVVSSNPLYALTGDQLKKLVSKILEVTGEEVSIFLTLKHAKKGTPTTYSEMHLHGKTHLEYTFGSTFFYVSPASFFQPNDYTGSILCATALEMLAPSKEERLLDLFCGLGTLGLYFAPYVSEVVGVEINKAAVADARDNALRNNIDNAFFFAEDVTTFIQDHQEAFDIVIVDPPRVGLEKRGVEALLTLKPKKILYISCNPKTQAEDLKSLVCQYKVEKIQPLDQFPHTPHIENLLLLTQIPSF